MSDLARFHGELDVNGGAILSRAVLMHGSNLLDNELRPFHAAVFVNIQPVGQAHHAAINRAGLVEGDRVNHVATGGRPDAHLQVFLAHDALFENVKITIPCRLRETGAAAAGIHARTYEAAILKTLGASRKTILSSFTLRSAFLGAAAGIVAIAAGAMAGWGVMTFVMETDYVFEPVSALLIVSGGVAATLLAGLVFAWSPLAARPARVLRARE